MVQSGGLGYKLVKSGGEETTAFILQEAGVESLQIVDPRREERRRKATSTRYYYKRNTGGSSLARGLREVCALCIAGAFGYMPCPVAPA